MGVLPFQTVNVLPIPSEYLNVFERFECGAFLTWNFLRLKTIDASMSSVRSIRSGQLLIGEEIL